MNKLTNCHLVMVITMLFSINAYAQCGGGDNNGNGVRSSDADGFPSDSVGIDVQASGDPNEIIGTRGYDALGDTLQWVAATASLPYTIYFENDPELATATALKVEVRHRLHAKADISTFAIGAFDFGSHVFTVEGNRSSYQQRLDLTQDMGIYVDVVAGIDIVAGEAFWILQSIDPATGLPPQGTQQGFLPVNDENHSGEGYVSFIIKPKANACITGDELTASASIVFDINEAIPTNVWHNTVDALPPTTQLTGTDNGNNEVLLQFSGQDDEGGCGIKQYKLYVSDNYGAYSLYDTYPVGTEATFLTEYDHCYRFFCLGEDNVGNVEAMKEAAEFEYGNNNLMVSVSANPEEGGTVTGEGLYTYNSQVTVTAVPAMGYEFYRWTNNGVPVSEEPTYTFSIVEEMNLVAQFVEANPEGFPFFVAGYGDSPNAGWVFLASPIAGCIEATTVDNIFSATAYDLYSFNQGEDLEWINYKSEPFELENGQGYLYATKEDQTLVFRGIYNNAESQEVTLMYTEDNPTVAMRGWNLIGNPFTVPAYVDRSYYTMNEEGTAVEPNAASSSTSIPVCNGVMVKAETAGETVTFSRALQLNAPNQGCLQITLNQVGDRVGPSTGSGTLVDKAIVSFNAGDPLGKYVLNESNAQIYIPQGGKDYAIAFAGNTGEIPLNFKTTKNGEYTIAVNTEGKEFYYLHLIDNLTGVDVDLLALRPFNGTQGPQAQGPMGYTFEARTTDYASRFLLRFIPKDGPSTGSGTENFAYNFNGTWIIANEGDATLQVVDVLGHLLSSETFSGSYEKKLNVAPGVYMLRLINGDNIKVQKIIVE